MTFPIRFSGKHLGDESRPKLLILLGALGEIRTPDPRIRSPMLYPAELRARARARLPDLARQGQHPAAGPVAAMSQHQTTVGRSLEKSISANDLGPRLNPS